MTLHHRPCRYVFDKSSASQDKVRVIEEFENLIPGGPSLR